MKAGSRNAVTLVKTIEKDNALGVFLEVEDIDI